MMYFLNVFGNERSDDEANSSSRIVRVEAPVVLITVIGMLWVDEIFKHEIGVRFFESGLLKTNDGKFFDNEVVKDIVKLANIVDAANIKWSERNGIRNVI